MWWLLLRSFLYVNQSCSPYSTMMYGGRFIEETREALQKSANWLDEKSVGRDNAEHDVWIVPVPFCAMHYINHGRSLSGSKASEVNCLWATRNNNVEFYRTQSLVVHSISSHTFLLYSRYLGCAYHHCWFGAVRRLDYSSSYDCNS